MTSVKCDIKGCDYTATHAKPSYAKAMIGRHKNYVHGIKGKKYIPKAVRNSALLETTASVERQTPNFCPNCGCNLRAITAALNLRGKS